MKKTRLLEIIREEIANALGETSYAGVKAIPDMKNDPSYKTLNQTGKMDAEKELKSGGTVELEEEQLDEMAKITEPIRKGIEIAVDRMIKQKSDISPEEITKLIRNKKTQEKVAPELKTALDADEAEKGTDPKYTYGLGYPQTLGAVQIAMGLKKAKGSEPKSEKPASTGKRGRPAGTAAPVKKATLTKGDDGFDDVSYSEPEGDEAAAAVGSDETAKELGKAVSKDKIEKFNTGLKFIKKYKDDKKIIDAYLQKAKDEYKLPANMIKDLKKAAGREVGI